MAVDFSLLPDETRFSGKPPSRLAWAAAFLTLVLTGVFSVLLFWPKGMPTNTSKFWVTICILPVGIAAFVVLVRFGHYERKKGKVEIENEAVRSYRRCVFEGASRPFAVTGSAYRFACEKHANDIDEIRSGVVQLTSREPAKGREVVRARWFENIAGKSANDAEDVEVPFGHVEDDRTRQEVALKWLFAEFLQEIRSGIQALSGALQMKVHLNVACVLSQEECVRIWRQCCVGVLAVRTSVPEPDHEEVDLGTVDRWLDEVLDGTDEVARLIVSVRLHGLATTTPDANSAEAGAALLLVPEAMAKRLGLARVADLHRPVGYALSQSENALQHALQWAGGDVADIGSGWRTGLNADGLREMLQMARIRKLDAKVHDLDQTVGHAGIAAPWLAIACAVAASSRDGADQLVFAGQQGDMCCAVVKHAGAMAATVASGSSRDDLPALVMRADVVGHARA